MTMNFVTFNQDYSYIAVGTSRGFRIFTTDPFAKSYETKEGNIAMLEMLFSTSLVALILSPRRLQIMNTKRQSTICEMTFSTTVLAVRLNRKRLVIVLEDQIYLYDIQTMKLLYTIETSPNPTAICTLSPSSENCYLAYPLPQKAPPSSLTPPHVPPRSTHVVPTSGEVLIFDTVKLEAINVIEAHRSPLCCIALNSEGTLLATASDKGTIIRVFSVPDGRKLYQFRRGSMPARIFHMSFNVTSTLLCVSSDTDTVHIFKLSPPQKYTVSPDASRPIGSSDGSEPHPTLSEESENFPGPSSHSNTIAPTTTSTSASSSGTAASTSATSPTSEIASRKPNGTLMGMIRRTSQNVGSSLANTVGGYLPKGVTEMWEPARDFAWIRLPKSAASNSPATGGSGSGSGGGGGSGSNTGVAGGNGAGAGLPGNHRMVRSMVAMCPNTPQVMVVTSDGYLYVYDVDLSKGGEGKLTKQYCYMD